MRGRKSSKIKTVTGKDKSLMKQIARTGICSKEQAKSYLGLNDNRLNQLSKSGYLKSETALVNKELVSVYRLDVKGKDYVKNNCQEVNQFYKFVSPIHDLCLTDQYYKVMQDEGEAILDSWRTEGDFLHDQEYEHSRMFGSCADGGYVNSHGVTQLIEIVTDNYSQEHIDSKEDFAESLDAEVSFYRV